MVGYCTSVVLHMSAMANHIAHYMYLYVRLIISPTMACIMNMQLLLVVFLTLNPHFSHASGSNKLFVTFPFPWDPSYLHGLISGSCRLGDLQKWLATYNTFLLTIFILWWWEN